eukprot:c23938_g1_i2 orf=718-2376(-)
MSAERYSTERSTLEKKAEWGGALVGHHHHHAYFHHHQQQSMKQTQHVYAHHHHLAGGCLDGATFQPDAGAYCAETPYANQNSNIDVSHIQQTCRFNAAANALPHCDPVDVATHTLAPSPSHHDPSQQQFGKPASDTLTNNDKNVTAAKPRQARSTGDHLNSAGKSNVSTSSFIKPPAPRRTRNTSMAPLTVRPTGTKDRHSKVRTAKGLRDRRVRLSAPTAIQFFDVQDRLGYDQPSKAVDWLIKKARAAIDELAPVEGVIMGDELTVHTPAQDQKLSKHDHHSSSVKVKDEEQSIAAAAAGGDARAESRAKARERARERAKEKGITSAAPSTTSAEVTTPSADPAPAQPYVPSAPSSNLHLLPDQCFLLPSQLRHQFDGTHHPSTPPSMLTPPSSATLAPQPLPFASHFFPGLASSSASSSFIYPGDVPPLQFSVPPMIYNNTPISPRGTLQSIFSNPANSSMQAHVPMLRQLMMMGTFQAHAYGAALSPVGGCDREGGHDNGNFQQNSAELRSPDLHQHSRIPMRIHGMELDAHVEENRMTPSSMQADFQ